MCLVTVYATLVWKLSVRQSPPHQERMNLSVMNAYLKKNGFCSIILKTKQNTFYKLFSVSAVATGGGEWGSVGK